MSSLDPNRPNDPAAPRRAGLAAEPTLASAQPVDPLGPPPPGTTVRNPTEARQAAPAGRMRYVLGFGMAFVIVGFFLVYLMTRP